MRHELDLALLAAVLDAQVARVQRRDPALHGGVRAVAQAPRDRQRDGRLAVIVVWRVTAGARDAVFTVAGRLEHEAVRHRLGVRGLERHMALAASLGHGLVERHDRAIGSLQHTQAQQSGQHLHPDRLDSLRVLVLLLFSRDLGKWAPLQQREPPKEEPKRRARPKDLSGCGPQMLEWLLGRVGCRAADLVSLFAEDRVAVGSMSW